MTWKERFPKDNRIYETKNGILYCGDSLKILQKFPSNSCDLLITDPPYYVSVEGRSINRNFNHYNWKRQSNIKLDFGLWDRQWKTDKEYFEWTEIWFSHSVRVLKPSTWLYIFFDKQKLGYFDLFLAPKYGIKPRTILVWAKTNPVPCFRKVNWISATEFIWTGSKGKCKLKNFLYQKEMLSYFLTPNSSSYRETTHPTEKPKKIIQKLVITSSNEGDIVLDPFAGSGTTCFVSEQLRRRWIGIEINKKYCEIIKKRLEKLQPTLF